ncbi:MAG: hypothetical protein A3A96_02600 [Candidatus Zambryskibacteria bacterium RIFCSPLOWO2_01_FULL_39_39]|uniref:Uncharacterized protein n=1 Tax=Candidatus Zambryskibacteria bacterium RIFCSPLOWO2_01_FULL_39_39 TaxID=1802758 RepID=A0A1G2TZQ9_9BACT|nr:MAG: hypothetical protein A2644_02315 [Candidatus Zambryskibacteria bacterium RIFCSPHIGHO2_01_FULL_39_63]OHA94839.1 MAG: hypothetical protein A3B88_04360 [Candidatus Zambryskibacteria bacterium RIFCSPHIGHO2_02_FULL_39_19]OHA98329.1 MAG: hypothetical protein A3F20_02050 [Candidatus Zambryskibacteria bacterium RIFCSPHIGHO2_12_FULL_39_21]OHB02714.1 MAG: hypothetical protein A3A96_02600 [Candidatus Zambryskibacteria bacterium RIFCSPLOWO2_01_FULL_39_39]
MRQWYWGGQTYTHSTDFKLWAHVHLALCKNVLNAKTAYIYESDREGQTIFSVLGVEVDRYQTANETIYNLGYDNLLARLLTLTPEQIREEHPWMYNSMIYHFGSVKATLKKRDWGESIVYHHHEDLSPYWAKEVVPFLEEMTDQQIADVCGCTPEQIANIRLIAYMNKVVPVVKKEYPPEESETPRGIFHKLGKVLKIA